MMATANPTFLQLINDISVKLTGRNAGTNSRPTKLEIGQAINDAQDAICSEKPNYSFLQKVSTIQAWKDGEGQFYSQAGYGTAVDPENPFGLIGSMGTAPSSSTSASRFIANNTGWFYMAERFKQKSGRIATIKEVRTSIVPYNPGLGVSLDGTFQAFLVGAVNSTDISTTTNPYKTNGTPDLSNVLATSDTYVIDNNIGSRPTDSTEGSRGVSVDQGFNLRFIFDGTVAIGQNEEVYIVVKFTPTIVNGWGFYLTQYSSVHSGYSYAWTSANDTTSFPVQILTTTGTLNMYSLWDIAVYNAGTPALPVDLPVDCRYVNRIYVPGGVNLKPYPLNQYQFNPDVTPTDVFVISGRDATTGKLQVLLFPSVDGIKTFSVDYQAIASTLVADTDYSVIPGEYRAILKWKAIMQLIGTNDTINIDQATFESDFIRALQKLNENFLPYENMSVSVSIGAGTDSEAETRDSTALGYTAIAEPNQWEVNS